MGLNRALVGLDDSFIDYSSLEVPLHREIIGPVKRLKAAAYDHGFDLCLASGYRSYQKQLQIWNEKAQGIRSVLDINEVKLEVHMLSKLELMHAILRWTALPGASRHHWGTDFDIYDAAAVDENSPLELTRAETQEGGPFAEMYRWLKTYLSSQHDFFRPYEIELNGVAPEPWHISYRPLAQNYLSQLNLQQISFVINQHSIQLKDEVLENLESIFNRYVKNISGP